MIVTVTCNPAIDRSIKDNSESFNIGGKGINVSKALNVLDTKSMLTGFLGKDNKEIVLNDLDSLKLNHHFVLVNGSVRTNTKRIINNELIEENEDGPFIDKESQNKLKEYLSTYISSTVVISGSLPRSADRGYYSELIQILKKHNCYVILDCDKQLLKEAIKAKPNVIKPNKKEICEYFNIEYDESLVITKCKELINDGIELVVVSLGKDGSLFISKDKTYKVNEIELNYVSSLCAGDSMVAAIAYGKENNLSLVDTIKLAVACARCSVEEIGVFTNKEKVNRYINNVGVIEINAKDKLLYGLCEECFNCRMKKYVYDVDLPENEKQEYINKQLEKINSVSKDISSYEFNTLIKEEYYKVYKPKDFKAIKQKYNQKMLDMVLDFENKINLSDDPMLYSLKLALIGNYIDFDAFDDIDDNRLLNMLNDADKKNIDINAYHDLCDELSKANSLVYLSDNCGEIVLDKLFIKEIKKRYPKVDITVMVRNKDALNDACLIDAIQVGLDSECKVIDNGLVGTKMNLSKLSEDKKALVLNADVLIAKGQANAESLANCGLNLFYIFLCKCNHFANNYHAKMFDGILCKERK